MNRWLTIRQMKPNKIQYHTEYEMLYIISTFLHNTINYFVG